MLLILPKASHHVEYCGIHVSLPELKAQSVSEIMYQSTYTYRSVHGGISTDLFDMI